jgi:signal transduction histidine kinase
VDEAYGGADELRQLCHDIREPMATVLAIADALLAEGGLPGHASSRVEQIAGLAQWQSEMIGHLLGQPGRVPPDADCADVAAIVNEASGAERLTWAGELRLEWPADPVVARVHPVILRRMTGNLLANATRAAGPGGTVLVRVDARDQWVQLVIEDTGPGFGRLPAKSGLGLRAVSQQAIRHGGKLECSRGDLGGARVHLWLPLAGPDSEEKAADAACSV